MLVHQCILWAHHRSRMHSRYYYYVVSKCKTDSFGSTPHWKHK